MITVHNADHGKFLQQIDIGSHTLLADATTDAGGEAGAPSPHDLLDAALGACTALTLRLVAARRHWPLEDARVTVTHTEEAGTYHLHREITLLGALTEEQRHALLDIANRCPVHRTLSGNIRIETQLI
ncbi:MAG: OsmC family protein [Rhodocyclaceae bacterium]